MDLREHIRTIPDFPKPGIQFYDISTLLAHPRAWRACVRRLADIVDSYEPDVLVGIESRGFLTAAPLALDLGLGFVMIRKQGKLPGRCITHTYDLEYGTDTIEIQADGIKPGQRVVILDDLLATGGTLAATATLCAKVGGDVQGAVCIIELPDLKGRDKLSIPFSSLIQFEGG